MSTDDAEQQQNKILSSLVLMVLQKQSKTYQVAPGVNSTPIEINEIANIGQLISMGLL